MTPDRKVKQAVFEMPKAPREGDLLMGAPPTQSWRQLCTWACDRDSWKTRVRALKQDKIAKKDNPKPTPVPKSNPATTTPKPKPPASPATRAKRYRKRDNHELFFQLKLKPKTRTKKKKKPPRQMTNKERAIFAREHYAKHHQTPTPTFSPPPILGHTINSPNDRHNTTIQMTPPSFQSMLKYQQNKSFTHRILKNLD